MTTNHTLAERGERGEVTIATKLDRKCRPYFQIGETGYATALSLEAAEWEQRRRTLSTQPHTNKGD